jgi:hypothetical protein
MPLIRIFYIPSPIKSERAIKADAYISREHE